jgi:hypothetical protein
MKFRRRSTVKGSERAIALAIFTSRELEPQTKKPEEAKGGPLIIERINSNVLRL